LQEFFLHLSQIDERLPEKENLKGMIFIKPIFSRQNCLPKLGKSKANPLFDRIIKMNAKFHFSNFFLHNKLIKDRIFLRKKDVAMKKWDEKYGCHIECLPRNDCPGPRSCYIDRISNTPDASLFPWTFGVRLSKKK
jgi:hypothetical protein